MQAEALMSQFNDEIAKGTISQADTNNKDEKLPDITANQSTNGVTKVTSPLHFMNVYATNPNKRDQIKKIKKVYVSSQDKPFSKF